MRAAPAAPSRAVAWTDARPSVPGAGHPLQRFTFETMLGSRRRGTKLIEDIDTPDHLERFIYDRWDKQYRDHVMSELKKKLILEKDHEMALVFNAAMDHLNGGRNKMKVPAADAIPPTDHFKNTIIKLVDKAPQYKNMETFLKKIAQGDEINGYKKANFYARIWSHTGNRRYVTRMGRAQGHQHEWLPTNMIGEIVTKTRRSDLWTSLYFTLRSNTQNVIFNSAVVGKNSGAKQVMTGHVGALKYRTNAKRLIDSTVYQPEFHDELRKVIINNEDSSKVKPGVKNVVERYVWRGDDPFPSDSYMHPHLYHQSAPTAPLFPRGSTFNSLRGKQQAFYNVLTTVNLK
ncbi:MAG: hypothetical protein AAGN35_09175 [Bacteroidota bacterium]